MTPQRLRELNALDIRVMNLQTALNRALGNGDSTGFSIIAGLGVSKKARDKMHTLMVADLEEQLAVAKAEFEAAQ